MTSSHHAARPTATPPHRRTTPLLCTLDREWERLAHRPSAVGRVGRWSGDESFERLVRSARSLHDIVDATQPGCGASPESCDAVLRNLVVLAKSDDLAGRIVLQRILPGVISRAQRWQGHAGADEPSDVAIGAAWIAIRRFDATARDRHLAPSLIADALWIGFRRDARRRVSSEIPLPASALCNHVAPTEAADPLVALAATLRAAAQAGARSSDLAVIRSIAAAGGPTHAAETWRVTVRTIRNRRDAASRRIRRVLGPDWADWSDPLAVA